MNVLDLFSGIGGFSLGLERAGMRTVAFCEIDPFCRKILAARFPDVPIFGDVRELTAEVLADAIGDAVREQSRRRNGSGRADPPVIANDGAQRIDVICGGFPCQDISVAGRGAGITGERSGLWSEYARIIGEVRPKYAIVENVAALLGRGIERVLGDLAALGFDAEWHCIPASAVGAPHRRDRVWIVAHADSHNGQRRQCSLQMGRLGLAREIADYGDAGRAQWGTEPGVGRVAHGVPARVDRLRALGNAIVPQIAEIIGRAIMMAEHEYDGQDDMAKSLLEGYRVIRERMANGGPGWTPKER